MSKIIISADSSCDLSEELIKKYDIKILPLFVTTGEDTYLDGVSITPDELYEYVSASGTLPKTAARSIGDYSDFFSNLVKDGSEVVHIALSSEFSSTFQNACIAAEEVDGVKVVDSANLSTGIGLAVLCACDLRDEGKTAEEIVEGVKAVVSKIRASFVVDSIEYLHKGGRCSAVAALGANLLKLRPSIFVVDGKMQVGPKYRGNIKKIFGEYAKDQLNIQGRKYNKRRVFVTHTCSDIADVEDVVTIVRDSGLFDEILITHAGCTVSSHCGPNTLGVLYIED